MTVLQWVCDNQSWLVRSYIVGNALSFMLFMLYLETSNKIGGILRRPCSDGRVHFNIQGIVPVLKYPFQSTHFWWPHFWDSNFIVFTQTGTAAFMLACYYWA